MFANTQMMGEGRVMSPLRTLGEMAHRTRDRNSLLVLQAGLEAMLKESKNLNAFVHDHTTAQVDLKYLESLTGRTST